MKSERRLFQQAQLLCDNCKGYVKMIALFSPKTPEMFEVQDLAALHLNFIAQKNGYVRGMVQ